MFIPLVLARIEEPDEYSVLQTRDVRSLVCVAAQASECEILEYGQSTVLSSDDVIDGEGKTVGNLWHAAVFAPAGGALTNSVF